MPENRRIELPKIAVGVVGGRTCICRPFEGLIMLPVGEMVTIFYGDNAVRVFTWDGFSLEEVSLTTLEQFACRVAHARDRLVESPNQAIPEMIDLLYMALRYDRWGIGDRLRTLVLQKFFAKLTEKQRQLYREAIAAPLRRRGSWQHVHELLKMYLPEREED